MNTPDTGIDEIVDEYKMLMASEVMTVWNEKIGKEVFLPDWLRTKLTSRDNYWKERLKKEVAGMPSVFHADNIPDSIQPGDIIRGKQYICRDTLLDKLKG